MNFIKDLRNMNFIKDLKKKMPWLENVQKTSWFKVITKRHWMLINGCLTLMCSILGIEIALVNRKIEALMVSLDEVNNQLKTVDEVNDQLKSVQHQFAEMSEKNSEELKDSTKDLLTRSQQRTSQIRAAWAAGLSVACIGLVMYFSVTRPDTVELMKYFAKFHSLEIESVATEVAKSQQENKSMFQAIFAALAYLINASGSADVDFGGEIEASSPTIEKVDDDEKDISPTSMKDGDKTFFGSEDPKDATLDPYADPKDATPKRNKRPSFFCK